MAGPGVPGSPTTDCWSGGSSGQRLPHKGWRARERGPGGGVRSPLREAHSGNNSDEPDERATRTNYKGLPYATPYSRKATAAPPPPGSVSGGAAEKIVTLRCMYTNQKTKKRKTWSDGAVKCYPKRQRVSLYRWSEALGVTDKLLGEIYLTVPQYEAFVTEAEPELEMEMYIASLDGVIQPDQNPPSSAPANAGATSNSASATSGGSADGTTTPAGRKRKLFKAFKPPSRREPVPSPPPDDPWGGVPPAGRLDQLLDGSGQSGDRRHLSAGGWEAGGGAGASRDGSGALPPRTTYTGFGHVESLWGGDDDEEDEEEEGDRRQDQRHCPGVESFPVESNGGWDETASASRGAQGGGRYEDVFSGTRAEDTQCRRQVGQSSLLPSAGAAVEEADGWMRGRENDGGDGGGGSRRGVERDGRPFAFPVRRDVSGDFAARQGRPQHTQSNLGDDPSSYSESLRSSDEGVGAWRGVDGPPDQTRVAGPTNGVEGYGSSGGREHGGSGGTVNEGLLFQEATAVPQHGKRDDAPEGDRGSSLGGGDDNAGGGAGAVAQMRSTQDILSLFGGFGQADAHDSQEALEQEVPAPAASPRGTNHTGDTSTLLPVGVVAPTRAADMRRAQKEAQRTAAGKASQPGGVPDAAAGQALATNTAKPAADWACESCGVRATSSSLTSCRVCGAKRQSSMGDNDVIAGHEVFDGDRGGVGVPAGSEEHLGWVGDESGGWDGQGWDIAAGNEGEEDAGEAHHDGAHRVTADARVSVEGRDDAGRGNGASPTRPLSSGAGSESGSAPRGLNRHRMGGARMQMDVGSSSDSDDA